MKEKGEEMIGESVMRESRETDREKSDGERGRATATMMRGYIDPQEEDLFISPLHTCQHKHPHIFHSHAVMQLKK